MEKRIENESSSIRNSSAMRKKNVDYSDGEFRKKLHKTAKHSSHELKNYVKLLIMICCKD